MVAVLRITLDDDDDAVFFFDGTTFQQWLAQTYYYTEVIQPEATGALTVMGVTYNTKAYVFSSGGSVLRASELYGPLTTPLTAMALVEF
jgi:hypothetical protein